MITMTYDQFDEIYDKMETLPSVIISGKGLTEDDLMKLQSDPDKYMPMIIYYLTRNFADDEHFSNSDAISGSEIKAELNRIIKENVRFTDD